VGGLTAVLVGLAPRLSGLAWVLVTWVVLSGLFGPLLRLPGWVARLSPVGWVPRVPAEQLDVVPLAGLVLVAAALVGVALAGYRRRDVLT
jgi:ABC-2 type transport system permease protein